MQNLLKFTYLLDIENTKTEINKLWSRYQDILENPNWDDLNEARAILFLLGDVYCEKFAVEAIERRLHLVDNKLNIEEFLRLAEFPEEASPRIASSRMFKTLVEFYKIIKDIKNKYVGGKYYLDEEKFIKLYNQYNPDKKLKIGYKGTFNKK